MTICLPIIVYFIGLFLSILRIVLIQQGSTALKGTAVAFTLFGGFIMYFLFNFLCNSGKELFAWIILAIMGILAAISIFKNQHATTNQKK